MTNRVTVSNLKAQIDYLNKITNSPVKPRLQVDGRTIAQIGCHTLDQAYGRVGLNRICNEGGGVTTPIYGLHTKRELYDLLKAYIAGIEFKDE